MLLFCCLFIIACSRSGENKPEFADVTVFVEMDSGSETVPQEDKPSADSTDDKPIDKIQFAESSETGHLKMGRLIHTIHGLRIVNDAEYIPPEGGFAAYCSACTYDSQGNETVWHYPDFIKEDGAFEEHVRLVLLDVEITSENAYSWIVTDLDENGNPKGHYENPFIFRIDGDFWLSKALDEELYMCWTPDFFSKMNAEEEDQFAYRLTPGESARFTVGFLVGSNYDGSVLPISDLYIRIPFGILGSGNNTETFIPIKE